MAYWHEEMVIIQSHIFVAEPIRHIANAIVLVTSLFVSQTKSVHPNLLCDEMQTTKYFTLMVAAKFLHMPFE